MSPNWDFNLRSFHTDVFWLIVLAGFQFAVPFEVPPSAITLCSPLLRSLLGLFLQPETIRQKGEAKSVGIWVDKRNHGYVVNCCDMFMIC